ncbi:4-hydroxyphenylpyruvate dioxygenase [Lujinxingia litoralis]|uniref:4-hydroxyphenylpyruvate dioxygenase n=2 Tax=Lujinxingia litoralis TaxID=2211119 RepID=A0A328CA63_9DELT|nr:4-hydroxyphenylpyruvate dioxygenase [Lujinxingia litoralis]
MEAHMSQIKNLGITGYDGLRFVTLDLERSRKFYVDMLDFTLIARSTPAWEDATGDMAEVYQAGDIIIECVESQRPDSWAAYHRKFHTAGIGTVNFAVRDIEEAFKRLEERGATIIEEIQTHEADGGTRRSFEIATPLGNTTYGFVEKKGYQGYAPGFEVVNTGGNNRFNFTTIDHLTSNVRTLKPLVDWFRDVLGMEQFWDIAFHTSDIDPTRQSGSGLKSIVMWDPEGGIKFANNEPARPFFNASQIQKYLEDFGGGGVQHAAFNLDDIIASIEEMESKGIEFLHTPPSYYQAAPGRMAEQGVSKIDEDYEVLQKHGILIDGEDEKYLLQIFMKEAALYYNQPEAGPFFIELIQRKGDKGFGGGNFRALFEAIERDQVERSRA